jgi:hypothetical protein
MTQSFFTHRSMSGQNDVRFSFPIPMVYESVPAPVQTHWEYHTLTVDAREEELPNTARLNELGAQGWLLVGVVDQGATGRSSLVHYYFVKQKSV